MFLQKVEIQGFKSFAGKTTLTFPAPDHETRGVTAVVGPNGSGKSNIADSLRWVLGEQSMKALRSKRSEDVIFFGSHTKSAIGMCEISLTFNNEDGGFPLDYPEVVIARRLYRSGESEYLINKHKVRLADLSLLLAQARIGQRSYCIVSQGMIDAILTASPAERKEYFDDAAGIREYQIKKDASILKLRRTEENLSQSNLALKEMEPKMKFLERQLKRREQRAEHETMYHDLLKGYFASLVGEYEQKARTHGVAHAHLQEARAQCEQECDRLRDELAVFEMNEGDAPMDSLQLELAALEGKKRVLTAAVFGKEGSAAHQSGQDLRTQIARIEARMDFLDREIKALRNNEAQAQKELNAILEADSTQGKALLTADILSELEDIVKDTLYEQLVTRVNALIGRIKKSLSSTRSGGIRQKEELIGRVHQVRARRERMEQELADLTEDRDRKQSELLVVERSTESPDAQESELVQTEKRIEEIRQLLHKEYTASQEARVNMIRLQKQMDERRQELHRLQQEEHQTRLELARIETRQEELFATMLDELPLTEAQRADIVAGRISVASLLEHTSDISDRAAAKSDIDRLKKILDSLGSIDEESLAEYDTLKERYAYLSGQVKDLEAATGKLNQAIHELDDIMEQRFARAMKKINEKFQEYFNTLFNGGSARIVLQTTDSSPLDSEEGAEGDARQEVISGIEIEATPPGKKMKSIMLLSGGERAMTAISLLCAILSTNPSPFVVLDEVDAALDESNALRFATILQELARQTQFIVITHNRVTIHTAQTLYGVTMGDDGVSHVLSLDIRASDATMPQ
ncbi:AAA family ATPase [Candidatus Uhrbacteria bacterium]|nr:AAA family ATPase [Candidatus Uhrbacteria bacterium]